MYRVSLLVEIVIINYKYVIMLSNNLCFLFVENRDSNIHYEHCTSLSLYKSYRIVSLLVTINQNVRTFVRSFAHVSSTTHIFTARITKQ